MTTSGTQIFDPQFDDILQDAAGMVGGGPILAEELISARRGMDYLLTSIQNENVLLHKVETTTVQIPVSTTSLAIDRSVLDVLSASILTNNTHIVLDRYGYQQWAEIAARSQTARPTVFWFDRERAGNQMNFWPLPNQAYTVTLTIQKNTDDTIRAFDNIDVPRRFLPAIVYGLAYWIGLRRSARVPIERLQYLQLRQNEELRKAMREDRERGSMYIRIGRR